MISERYNCTSTLVIEMYLNKYDAYSILNSSQAHLAAVILLCLIEKQLPVQVRNVCAKNFPVNFNADLYTLRLLSLPTTCSKVRNSVFSAHCTVDTLNVVHIFEIREVTPSTTLTDRQHSTHISGNLNAI